MQAAIAQEHLYEDAWNGSGKCAACGAPLEDPVHGQNRSPLPMAARIVGGTLVIYPRRSADLSAAVAWRGTPTVAIALPSNEADLPAGMCVCDAAPCPHSERQLEAALSTLDRAIALVGSSRAWDDASVTAGDTFNQLVHAMRAAGIRIVRGA